VKGVIDEEKIKGVLMLKRWISKYSWKKIKEEFVPFARS
jgi:hypothetical protein